MRNIPLIMYTYNQNEIKFNSSWKEDLRKQYGFTFDLSGNGRRLGTPPQSISFGLPHIPKEQLITEQMFDIKIASYPKS